MGKKLIIKDADFSANAIEIDIVSWMDMQLYQPSVYTNPSNTNFGKEYNSGQGLNAARNKSTITLPNGKKLIVKIVNNSGNSQMFNGNSVSYSSSFAGALPSGLAATSFTFGGSQGEYNYTHTYLNNSGNTLNVIISVLIQNVSTITPSSYLMKYVVEDIDG